MTSARLPQGRRGIDGAVEAEACSVVSAGLDAAVRLDVAAPGRDELEVSVHGALELLAHLDRSWGPGGELQRLVDAPTGSRVLLSWDTVLLLGRGRRYGVAVDVPGHSAEKIGPFSLPDLDECQALAARLLLAELIESGAILAEVVVGRHHVSTGGGLSESFEGSPAAPPVGEAR